MTSGLPWGLAVSSGVNTYLPLFIMALFARSTHVIRLSPRFQFLTSDQALIILGLLAACEVLAQKFPVLDNVWDLLHTLLRPLAGAIAAGATLDASSAFETVLAMLVGGSLAAAAHSTKSSLRLASTSKTFGAANLAISLGEDAAVVTGTLLSVYAPWVMLVVVALFVLFFILIGPRVLRTLRFDLGVVGAWLVWLGRRILGRSAPRSLEESLLDLEPRGFEALKTQLAPGERLLGGLAGWRRAPGGPRSCLLGFTSDRVLMAERRFLRKPRLSEMLNSELSMARCRSLGLFSRLDLVSRASQAFNLIVPKTQAEVGVLAVERIRSLAGHNAGHPEDARAGAYASAAE